MHFHINFGEHCITLGVKELSVLLKDTFQKGNSKAIEIINGWKVETAKSFGLGKFVFPLGGLKKCNSLILECFVCYYFVPVLVESNISLQNRRISGASARHERAREARARTRSARHEISACKHTIVYALPPPVTLSMTSQSQC